MSEEAYFVCDTCQICVGLGKPLRRPDRSIDRFHDGIEDSENSARPDHNRSLWKFIADHAEHPMRVALQYSEDFSQTVDNYIIIGGDAADGDIPFDQYIEHWQG